MPAFDRERAAKVLVDAHLLGAQKAAERWGCTDRTVQNYRERLDTDAELARLYAVGLKVAEEDWRSERLRFLRKGLTKLDELTAMAKGPEHIRDVAQAIKVVGELQVASDVLNGDHTADPADPLAPATPGAAPADSQPVH